MRPSQALETHRAALRSLATRYRVRNMRAFGSVVSATDTEDSDLDLLVDPTPRTTLMDLAAICVDVLTPNSLPAAFREQVLREATPV